ncbi:hypothetical protein LGR54_24785 [Ancylobacter sp. Lp-2]|uniref:hypothetical protein n=1 Tax=Ancylobacter sp. Lp-2 TaxID=2881339 RepID=UPI001E42FD0B|nr:hypothetical protein [Ancylobacter sp. Lp-2]MCB4771831.1 hypothetical protein [Ancylobacter sp. Lp-2]
MPVCWIGVSWLNAPLRRGRQRVGRFEARLSPSVRVVPAHVVNGLAEEPVHEAPASEWGSVDRREYSFRRAFTEGRGPSRTERAGADIVGFWAMGTACTTMRRQNGRKNCVRAVDGGPTKTCPTGDVIDLSFALKVGRATLCRPIDGCR